MHLADKVEIMQKILECIKEAADIDRVDVDVESNEKIKSRVDSGKQTRV